MHEMSLVREMVRLIEAEAGSQGFSRVSRISLSIGTLSCAAPEALRFAFASIGAPLLEGAELEIERHTAIAICRECGRSSEVSGRLEVCSHCGSEHVAVDAGSGDELKITGLEVF